MRDEGDPNDKQRRRAEEVAVPPPVRERAAPQMPARAGRQDWTVGADGVVPAPRRSGQRLLPVGLLHAVDGSGLLHGRALCLAPVVPLDPAQWRWTGDDGPGEVCWICIALTHRLSVA